MATHKQLNAKDTQIKLLKKQVSKYKEEAVFWKEKYQNMEAQYRNMVQFINNDAASPFRKNVSNKHHQSYCGDISQENSFYQKKSEKNQECAFDIDENDDECDDDDLEESIQKLQTYNNRAKSTPVFKVQKLTKKDFQKLQVIQQNKNSIIDYQNEKSNRQKNIEMLKNIPEPFEYDKDIVSLKNQESSEYSPRINGPIQPQVIDFFGQGNQEETVQENQQQGQNKSQKGLNLIEGYFILEKINNFSENCKNLQKWVRVAEQSMHKKDKQLLDIVYRYSFADDKIQSIEDDPFESRKNQIKFGTPYQDYIYSFDNFDMDKQESSDGGNKFFKKSMRMKYVHCLIRPEIIEKHGKFYQTEILYALVSPFPIRTFFQDLHRTIQQQIKFEYLRSQKTVNHEIQINLQDRIKITSILMEQLYQNCLHQCCNINNYPINLSIVTGVSNLQLYIDSKEELARIDQQSLQTLAKKYNPLKLSKILHYALAQKSLMIVCNSRKALNQVIQIVRLMLKPFRWVFPIVFRYSPYFEPFLSSPMPLILGAVVDFFNKQQSPYSMPENELVTIFVDDFVSKQKLQQNNQSAPKSSKKLSFPTDEKQLQPYSPDIRYLQKYLTKNDKKSKSNTSDRIRRYVNQLKCFVTTGKVQKQLSPFMIQFMDTQMVQYFKDVITDKQKINNSQKTINKK